MRPPEGVDVCHCIAFRDGIRECARRVSRRSASTYWTVARPVSNHPRHSAHERHAPERRRGIRRRQVQNPRLSQRRAPPFLIAYLPIPVDFSEFHSSRLSTEASPSWRIDPVAVPRHEHRPNPTHDLNFVRGATRVASGP